MLPHFGPVELILILVIVTMLFGVGKLPEVFGAVGKGVREFRKNSANDVGARPTPLKPPPSRSQRMLPRKKVTDNSQAG